MSQDEIINMRIENLIYKINVLGSQRKNLVDQIWAMETESEKLRLELIDLVDRETGKK